MTLGGIFDELSPCWHVADIRGKKSPIALCLLSTFPIQISNDPCNVQVYSISHTNKMKITVLHFVNMQIKNVLCSYPSTDNSTDSTPVDLANNPPSMQD